MAQDGPREQRSSTLNRRDAATAGGLFLLAALCYRRFAQPELLQDGPGLLEAFLYGEPPYCPHPAYVPLARAWDWIFHAGTRNAATLWQFSAFSAAFGLGCTYLLARALAAPAAAALVVALACGLARAVACHATLVELHAQHFGASAAAALACVLALRCSARVWVPVFALCAVVLYTTHKTASLMLPGLVLLPWALRPPSEDALRNVLLAAAALGAGLWAGLELTRLHSGAASSLHDIAASTAALTRFGRGFELDWLSGEWLRGLGVLVPLGLLGVYALRRERLALALLVLVGVPSAFFSMWGARNDGGYLLGCLPWLCVAAARTPKFTARRLELAGSAAVAAQLLLLVCTRWPEQAPERLQQLRDERAAAVALALGDAPPIADGLPQAHLIAIDRSPYPVHLSRRAIREWRVNSFVAADATPQQAVRALETVLDLLVAQAPGRVAVIAGSTDPTAAAWAEQASELRSACNSRYAVHAGGTHGWEVLVLDARR